MALPDPVGVAYAKNSALAVQHWVPAGQSSNASAYIPGCITMTSMHGLLP
jgi:hypothetical protein